MLNSCNILPTTISSFGNARRFIRTVTVIGGGLMGSGIAQVAAQNGYNTHLVDIEESQIKKSVKIIKKNLERSAKKMYKDDASLINKFVEDNLALIKPSTDIIGAAKVSDLIVEAIVENLSVKHKLFRELDAAAPSPCIFATNTSSLSLKDVSSILGRKDRFGGLHFFNPVPMMQLVEVVRTSDTSDATFKALIDFGKSVGKTTVECKDTPGFIVNRLLIPYLMEASRMLERADASASDIDVAMKLGAGYPMGPFELADYVGLDTIQFITEGWSKKYPDNPLFKPSAYITRLVKEGKLGRKTGEGFYRYDAHGNPVK